MTSPLAVMDPHEPEENLISTARRRLDGLNQFPGQHFPERVFSLLVANDALDPAVLPLHLSTTVELGVAGLDAANLLRQRW